MAVQAANGSQPSSAAASGDAAAVGAAQHAESATRSAATRSCTALSTKPCASRGTVASSSGPTPTVCVSATSAPVASSAVPPLLHATLSSWVLNRSNTEWSYLNEPWEDGGQPESMQ